MDPVNDSLVPVLRELLSSIERKFAYASVLVNRSHLLNVSASSREEQIRESGPNVGAVFSAWNGEMLEEVATGDVSNDGLAAAARELLGRPAGPLAGGLDVPEGAGGDLTYRTPMQTDPAGVPLEEKMDLCRKGRDRAAALDSRVVEAQCSYMEERTDSLFVSRTASMSQDICRVLFYFNDVFRDGSVVRYDGEMSIGTGGYELARLPDSDWEAVRARIPGLLKATPMEPGYYDIVVSPSAAGVIAHEAFGHGVETDMFLKGRAKSRQYLGKPVGSSLVNLYDDPTYPGGFGTYGFDDQGQPASKTQILRNGVFVQGLTDLYSAIHLGISRTANGRRENVNKAYPRMTNTYFGLGEDSLEAMIASVDHGVYLGPTESGMEDPKDWGVQCVLGWARDIEHGKLTDRYHTRVGLTGYVPELLGSISMVGKDLRLWAGGCGKGYKEFVRVGMGGPHLKMKGRLG